jgi:hypothetical protein
MKKTESVHAMRRVRQRNVAREVFIQIRTLTFRIEDERDVLFGDFGLAQYRCGLDQQCDYSIVNLGICCCTTDILDGQDPLSLHQPTNNQQSTINTLSHLLTDWV